MAGMRLLIACADAATERRFREAPGAENACMYFVRSAAEAMGSLSERPIDVAVVDAVLPGMDGYALARRIRESALPVLPGVIVTAFPGMERGICLPGVITAPKNAPAEEILKKAVSLLPDAREMPEIFAARADRILDILGVPKHPGRDYLRLAVFMMHEDMTLAGRLTAGLYPRIAERFSVTAAVVERGMRHVIDTAWAKGDMDSQYAIFKNTIDAARGKPTCGGMIAQLAHMLRREVFP